MKERTIEKEEWAKKDPLGAIFAERIRQIRKSKGMSKREFADRLFVTYASVLQYELGYNAPGIDKLRRIAKALDVPLRELFDFDALEAVQ